MRDIGQISSVAVSGRAWRVTEHVLLKEYSMSPGRFVCLVVADENTGFYYRSQFENLQYFKSSPK
jgi:hypothetical protein